jgi:ketosteroid isomerase-like protein
VLHPDIAVVKQFHQALISNDADALRELLADDALWSITGKSQLAGEHKGAVPIIDLVAKMHELTGGTFRPWNDDSHDELTSEAHTVLSDRFLANRPGKELDSHEAIFLHAEDGKITSLFHYFGDQYAFDEFWS